MFDFIVIILIPPTFCGEGDFLRFLFYFITVGGIQVQHKSIQLMSKVPHVILLLATPVQNSMCRLKMPEPAYFLW